MNLISESQTKTTSIYKVMSGSFLIAGTMIGAGMLGIPMATAEAGFIPACIISLGVWFFMLITGFLLLEICLNMPKGSNFLSISEHFLGKTGRYFIGSIFIFLYYCLLVAYIAGGAPLFYELVFRDGYVTWISYLTFSAIFAFVIFLGLKWINRINIVLTTGMFLLFFIVILMGLPSVEISNLTQYNFSKIFISVPVLFSAFGYHNVIPSLCDYLERDRKILSFSLILGSLISLIIYLLWQQVVLGAVSINALNTAMHDGKTCIFALQEAVENSNLYLFSKFFASTALATSFLGVSLSVVDFLQDGLANYKIKRSILCLIVFVPSTFLAVLHPTIFSKSLGIAGGIGEAILNGIFPVVIVWLGLHYRKDLFIQQRYCYGKKYLIFLLILGFLAMGIEVLDLL